MMKKLKELGISWIVVWFLVYVAFLILGMNKENEVITTTLKYGGLVLCFIYTLVYSRKDVFLVIALGLTVIADGILIYNNASEIGVLVFIFVQMAHFLRFSRIRAISPILPILASALVIILGMLQKEIPTMFILAISYGILMFTNIFEAFCWYRESRSAAAKYALIGFILFFICDLFVGLSFVTTTTTLPHTVTLFANYMAWVFYLPSQVFLAFSGKKAKFSKVYEKIDLPEIKLRD
ncbi:hypothetical protein IKG73_00300 [Candidatus Saccharibacteria bacterium]|nr:hypothetical protein [Candidatus Saccharibacteria bacterium]